VPTYQYACTACGHQLEVVQSFSDAALTQCPDCDGRLRKLYSGVGIVFKGSGFYRTDSRAGSSSEGNGGGSNETAGAGTKADAASNSGSASSSGAGTGSSSGAGSGSGTSSGSDSGASGAGSTAKSTAAVS
jgi:putative FmdB family regulatory protein